MKLLFADWKTMTMMTRARMTGNEPSWPSLIRRTKVRTNPSCEIRSSVMNEFRVIGAHPCVPPAG